MISRGQNFKSIPLNIVGSSVFGRYPKIDNEHTINMFASDNFLVPYAGYSIAINRSYFNNGIEGRATFTSTKLNKMIVIIDNNVWLVDIFVEEFDVYSFASSQVLIGTIETTSGICYITENNKPQILISDNVNLYIYDPEVSSVLTKVTGLNFTPGYITFHDTYFLCAASNDTYYTPPASNTWRLSDENDGSTGHWNDTSANIGLLQTKPDKTQAVVRFPSKGNMILVMGKIVTEAWYDTGAQLFPYQRSNQLNIDYGCVSPATVAYMDEIVVWLAQNEKSGPIIMYSMGGMPIKVTTDGIDYLFSQLIAPQDSQGFLYRQDGHLFYHINFYTDNMSFFVDFLPDGSHKIYEACDQNLDYFIAAQISYFNNQYYFVSQNTGNLYSFDTIYTTYKDTASNGTVVNNAIPRIRSCKNIRMKSQEYFIINDIGFTIETGTTDYYYTDSIVDGEVVSVPVTPRVDLTVSYDGGETFSNAVGYDLKHIGQYRNKLMWWQGGICNDAIMQFKFWGMGRFVVTDGMVNIRQ